MVHFIQISRSSLNCRALQPAPSLSRRSACPSAQFGGLPRAVSGGRYDKPVCTSLAWRLGLAGVSGSVTSQRLSNVPERARLARAARTDASQVR